ncbi:uncharacterized protein LOC755639 [Strongylocentrotus purpuratus]|uniref:DUF4550 domain-containing protein n=1 Tax=Strongylocentrotus purpuratus TaxID=7668 RepID=A0A7M7G019_STRPU|nr:uncharacterized protein LOC755639 [Strongylocentrotus purpuratus]
MSATEQEGKPSNGSETTEGESEKQPDGSIPSLEGERESLQAEEESLKSDSQERSGSTAGKSETSGQEVESVKEDGADGGKEGSDEQAGSQISTETSEETETADSFSSAEIHASRRGRSRKKKDEPVIPEGEHTVTLSVVIAKAIPTVDDPDMPKLEDVMKKKKQRIVEAPKAQGYYHCQYYLLPDDAEPIRTDVVTFGMAAKIYTEHDSKVLKTWQEGDLTWVAWSHSHKLHVTKDVLLKLFNHNLELRVWESREKVAPKARFDRPKAFRLPHGKPGEDAQDIGGVRSLVLKQSMSYEALQPRKSCLDRPVPTKGPPEMGDMKQYQKRDEKGRLLPDAKPSRSHSNEGSKALLPKPPFASEHTVKLHHSHHESQSARKTSKAESTTTSKLSQRAASSPPHSKDSTQAKKESLSSAVQGKDGVNGVDGGTPRSGTRRVFKDSPMQREAKRKSYKAEQAAAANAAHIKKYGNACIPIRMKLLFADLKTVTNRLESPVVGIKDVFITVSLDGPLMSPDQRLELNPLVLKVVSALGMPETPLSHAELGRRCMPVHTSYKFCKQPEYKSRRREHSKNIYWDDINVELLGIIPKGELLEYLRGAPLEIQVHDRDRRPEDIKQKPTLFGEDTEDDKISNVGMVASKRTTHNPFKGRIKPWDPYGIAKIDLSGLLLGEKIIYQTSPIHNCPLPDLLGRGVKNNRLMGVSNAADGPKDEPLPVGHYIDSGARLKVRLEVAHAITTPQEVQSKPAVETHSECPFSCLVYVFGYKNTKFLHQLLRLVISINAEALDLGHLPDHIVEAALSTYKLSTAQQKSSDLDIVTGFQILDGEKHIFVLEGLRDHSINKLWSSLPRPQKQDGVIFEALYNSDMMFSERKYAALDVDLCRIKLHEPMSVIVKQPLLYVRDMVPRPCFEALIKLDQLVGQDKLRNVNKNDLYPSAESIISLSREFGVPLTTADFEDLKERDEPVYLSEDAIRSHSASQVLPSLRHRRIWTPLEIYNPDYIMYKEQMDLMGPMHDFIKENINHVNQISEENTAKKVKPRTIRIEPVNGVAHNYSSQTLNATEQAKELLRQELAQEPDRRFTYCKDFNSASVVPVNVEAVKKAEEQRSKGAYQTDDGFVYPGIPISMESNVHPMKPDPARRDELKESWIENILHDNVLKPTLEYRSRYEWEQREQDMNLWRKPLPSGFQPVPPITIHLAGDTLKAEKQAVKNTEQDVWRSKVKVYDTQMHFHRVATETELMAEGFKSSNQIDRLRGLLKDEAEKLALRQANFQDMPALSVVMNPSVDTAAREAGLPIPEMNDDRASMLGQRPIFMPGAFPHASLALSSNRIPIKDMEHAKFEELKGYDFRLYHKDRGPVHKRLIQPLATAERDNHLFRNLPSKPYKAETSKPRPGNECFRNPPPGIYPAHVHTEFYYPDREKFLAMGDTQKNVTQKKKVLESAM